MSPTDPPADPPAAPATAPATERDGERAQTLQHLAELTQGLGKVRGLAYRALYRMFRSGAFALDPRHPADIAHECLRIGRGELPGRNAPTYSYLRLRR